MYLKSQCARNHGNQVQSQPHGSEPLSPQNKKEKRKNQRTHKKEEKREALHPRKEREKKEKKKPKSPTYTPRNPSALIQQNKNQQTRKPRTSESKNQSIPVPTINHPLTPCAPTLTKPPNLYLRKISESPTTHS